MTKTNPFPGMNPFLERYWPDVHTRLVAYIADTLGDGLPDDLSARSEERVTLHQTGADDADLVADVAIIEPWQQGVSPQWQPSRTDEEGGLAVQPQIIMLEENTERWLEITDKHGRLITVIEVLSPSNKGADRSKYITRREAYIHSRVNLVEIDLLRGGAHTVAVPQKRVRKPPGASYLVCVTRMGDVSLREVYAMSLRQPLSPIRVPLRQDEPDFLLALQPLIDRCYSIGRYYNADHTTLPAPPLSEEDSTWVAERLQAAGLK